MTYIIALWLISRGNSSVFGGIFASKRNKQELRDEREYIVLKEATEKEVEKIKALKATKVAREKEELIKFRKVVKKYGTDGIYFLAFGGEEEENK